MHRIFNNRRVVEVFHDYLATSADRLYWMNWVTKCIESISLNGEDWFSVNPMLPAYHGSWRSSDGIYDDSMPLPSTTSTDFHPYAIDVFQGAVLFSEVISLKFMSILDICQHELSLQKLCQLRKISDFVN